MQSLQTQSQELSLGKFTDRGHTSAPLSHDRVTCVRRPLAALANGNAYPLGAKTLLRNRTRTRLRRAHIAWGELNSNSLFQLRPRDLNALGPVNMVAWSASRCDFLGGFFWKIPVAPRLIRCWHRFSCFSGVVHLFTRRLAF